MKRKLIITLFIISAISLYGCSTSSVEKKPVVVKETQEDISPVITVTPTVSASEEAVGNTDSKLNDTSESYPYTIELEGTKESINAKTYQSKLGYQMIYDTDRFTVTGEDGIDSYMAPNSDPNLYPYIYLNVSRDEIPATTKFSDQGNAEFTKVTLKDENGKNFTGYISSTYSKLVPGDKTSISGYKLTEDSVISPKDTVKIGNNTAVHYTITAGTKWNSAVTEFFFITTDNYIYTLVSNYYTEAAEGYGARLRAMIDTFTIE